MARAAAALLIGAVVVVWAAVVVTRVDRFALPGSSPAAASGQHARP